jgi:hypothetical protein
MNPRAITPARDERALRSLIVPFASARAPDLTLILPNLRGKSHTSQFKERKKDASCVAI